jgi:prolyl-tRNA synthetase
LKYHLSGWVKIRRSGRDNIVGLAPRPTTLREEPGDAELASHKLLIRANYIRPLSAGIYTFMPLGYRVLRKIWAILSEEMDAIGGQEMWMPNLHPASIWQATGRWTIWDPVLLKLKGKSGRDYTLSPTHEEVVNEITLSDIDSYRDLPRLVYHITKKFRDEPRPGAAWSGCANLL